MKLTSILKEASNPELVPNVTTKIIRKKDNSIELKFTYSFDSESRGFMYTWENGIYDFDKAKKISNDFKKELENNLRNAAIKTINKFNL